MLCKTCEARTLRGPTRRIALDVRVTTCEQCGVVIVTLRGVALGEGERTLARLARFGLSAIGAPLLEPKREGT